MARIARPSAEHHQDHLRRLIDQRAARANLPGPSPQFADTPSVYSPSIAVFSPYVPSDPSSSRYKPSDVSHPSLPVSSMLDLDDDSRTSTYSSVPDHSSDSLHGVETDDEVDDDDDFSNRMSMLGPKMRFHSRAPWETGDDVLQEEEEVPSPTYEGAIAVSEPPSRIEGLKKGFRFGTSKSARGSEDSEDSRGKYQRSFETASSRTSDASHSVNTSMSVSLP